MIVDQETGEWEAIPNPALDAMGGAGTQAAQYIAGLGAGKVVSGHFGPNAHLALNAAGIAMYTASGGSVESAMEELKAGNLQQVSGPTVGRKTGSGGRRGMGRR